MDIQERFDRLEQWIIENKLIIQKTNEQSWGSYQPAISWDGNQFGIINRWFGFGYTTTMATAMCLEDALQRNDEGLLSFFGDKLPSLHGLWAIIITPPAIPESITTESTTAIIDTTEQISTEQLPSEMTS